MPISTANDETRRLLMPTPPYTAFTSLDSFRRRFVDLPTTLVASARHLFASRPKGVRVDRSYINQLETPQMHARRVHRIWLRKWPLPLIYLQRYGFAYARSAVTQIGSELTRFSSH